MGRAAPSLCELTGGMEGEFPGSERAPESGAGWEGLDSMISEFWVILGLSEAVPALLLLSFAGWSLLLPTQGLLPTRAGRRIGISAPSQPTFPILIPLSGHILTARDFQRFPEVSRGGGG